MDQRASPAHAHECSHRHVGLQTTRGEGSCGGSVSHRRRHPRRARGNLDRRRSVVPGVALGRPHRTPGADLHPHCGPATIRAKIRRRDDAAAQDSDERSKEVDAESLCQRDPFPSRPPDNGFCKSRCHNGLLGCVRSARQTTAPRFVPGKGVFGIRVGLVRGSESLPIARAPLRET